MKRLAFLLAVFAMAVIPITVMAQVDISADATSVNGTSISPSDVTTSTMTADAAYVKNNLTVSSTFTVQGTGATQATFKGPGKVVIGDASNAQSMLVISTQLGSNFAQSSHLGSAMYLGLGADEFNSGGASTGTSFRYMGFGYLPSSGKFYPAYFGFNETTTSGNTAGDLVFGARSATTDSQPPEAMRIQGGGNVGIGTANPSSKLEVNGGSVTIQGSGAGLAVANATFTVVNAGFVTMGGQAKTRNAIPLNNLTSAAMTQVFFSAPAAGDSQGGMWGGAAASGTFTVPAAGDYRAEFSAYLNSAGVWQLEFRVNNSQKHICYQDYAVSSTSMLKCATSLNGLAANDTVTVFARNPGASAQFFNAGLAFDNFSLEKIR